MISSFISSLAVTQNVNVCSSFTNSKTRSGATLENAKPKNKEKKERKKENQIKTLIDWLAKRNGRGSI
jgi:hypothetical protein